MLNVEPQFIHSVLMANEDSERVEEYIKKEVQEMIDHGGFRPSAISWIDPLSVRNCIEMARDFIGKTPHQPVFFASGSKPSALALGILCLDQRQIPLITPFPERIVPYYSEPTGRIMLFEIHDLTI